LLDIVWMETRFERLYQRWGPKYLRRVVIIERLCIVVFVASLIVAFNAYRTSESGLVFEVPEILVAELTVMACLEAALLIVRRRSEPLLRWMRGEGDAADAWAVVTDLPMRWLRTHVLALLPGCAGLITLLALTHDISGSEIAPLALGFAAGIAVPGLVEYHLVAFVLRPLQTRTAVAAAGRIEAPERRSTLRRTLVASFLLMALLTAGSAVVLSTAGHPLGSVWRPAILTIVIGGALAIALGFVITGSLNWQLRRLESAMRSVREGSLGMRLPVVSTDELGSLAVSFNAMVEGLEERHALHERALRLEAEAERLTVERDTKAREEVASERARIARELHDVVAHALSIVVVQAGAAREMVGRDTERTDEALTAIEESGREALSEMRRFVRVLRRFDEAPLGPQPALTGLESLADGFRDAGLAVEITSRGVERRVEPGIALSVYRIVQEALTNTLRHAQASRAWVRLHYDEACIEVEVTDDGTQDPEVHGAPSGHGLVGMRERATAVGGVLTAGPREGGGFAVQARIPLPEKHAES
jgi:signal transduction histidine kinase